MITGYVDVLVELFDLDRVCAALQADSCIGDYFLEDSTLDRRAETIMKMEEDLLGFPTYPVNRTVCVIAGEPIAVTEMLVSGTLPAKGGAFPLTELLEKRLCDLLK